ncbi:efflux transporter outer membrane subunit [Flavobacterium nackdongense]|uniref:Efflux transporter outer membrane subunit n=1 Tax=Flavobacterium nackdongense TaxID=2547394 RepID=A0A4P6YBM2_9FLAO|nr:efflux transporter outer membrane subunit [Flavobacterium nackdongense]QBN17673.1 efflux transporter outer membrane subunit [Flavobacterium nackdongense]
MKSKIKIVVVILILAILPVGCLVGPKYKKPEEQSAATFRNGATNVDTLASVVNIKWFDLFNDDVLKGLINKGLSNNYDMRIAMARIERTRAELGYTKADLLPAIGYGATVNSNDKSFTPNTASATLSWELDFWGKIRHENRAVQNELLASEEGRKVILSNLVSDIAVSYFQLRDFDNRLIITQKTLETRQKAYDIINQRFKAGYVSEVDLMQVEQQVAIAEATIPAIKRQITNLENTISILMGQAPGPIERGKSSMELQVSNAIPESIPSILLRNRPDVNQAERLYMASNERIGVAQAMRFPSFNIAALAGFASGSVSTLFDGSSYLQNASAGVAGPIFNFGKNKRRVEIYRQIAEESRLSYQKTCVVAVAEVEQSLQNVKTYKDEWTARNRQVIAARKNLELSNARYYNGYISYLEVLDIERALFEAELSLSELTQNQLSSMVQLYRALGGGWN